MTDSPANAAPFRLIDDVEFGDDVTVWSFSNLYGCRIGSHTRIGSFVEVQRGASIGAACKISSHSFICDGVTLEDGVFVGHGVMFTNDRLPRALTVSSEPAQWSPRTWRLIPSWPASPLAKGPRNSPLRRLGSAVRVDRARDRPRIPRSHRLG